MADQPVTREKLINADIDVDNLGKAVNELGVVNPRYGDTYKTLPQIASEYEQNGATRGFNTRAEFDAVKTTIPAYTVVNIAEAGENQGQNIWNGIALTKSPYDPLTQAKTYAEQEIDQFKDNDFKPLLEGLLKPRFEAASKNLLDPLNILKGKNINSSGDLVDRVETITTGLIDVSKGSQITISGLTPSTYPKYGRFFRRDFTRLATTSIPKDSTSITLPNTYGATYFQFTMKDFADRFDLEPSQIQVEYGSEPTPLTPFVRGKAVEIYGAPILDMSSVVLNSDFTEKVNTSVNPIFIPGSRNIFRPNNIVPGKVVSGTGSISDEPTGMMTGLIDVFGETNLTVSGFSGDGVGGDKAIRFLDASMNLTGLAIIASGHTSRAYTIPDGTKYAQMTLKARTTSNVDPNLIQFEFSSAASSFTPYIADDLSGLFGVQFSRGGIKSRAHGASYLLFGDSITETSDVDSGIFDSTARRVNWPVYAKDLLRMSVYRNYAKSGASFKNRSLLHYQFLGNQITKAIENNEKPDVIVVACGTNDGLTDFGDYTTAVAKATLEDLDQTLCLEAARHAFWTLRLHFPDAICFYANPIQRASTSVDSLDSFMNGMARMAKRYGFVVIDQNKESGIIRELENVSAAGKYLHDGLHPNADGSQRMARYIAGKITSHMLF